MQVSASGSMSTVSKEDNLVFSSEDSSSPDESELELGLSLGGGGAAAAARERQGLARSRCARILTAKDFPSGVSSSASSSLSASSSATASSSSSSSLSRASVTAGTKRSAESVAAGNGASQVVGWPPIRAYRMNSLVNQAKSPATDAFDSMDEENRCMSNAIGKAENGDEKKNGNSKVKGHVRNSLFVKVNMDGIPIGRKIDLSAHNGYEALARTLEDMFNEPTMLVKLRSSGKDGPSRLLDGSSEHVLTYEDREGDWMLVGDVPWGMFLSSVKRLRIMRTSEANGLSPRLQERNGRQRCQPI